MNAEIITNDRRMRDLIQLAKSIATSKASVLIQGENGTGKDLMAQLVHESSTRSLKAPVVVACAGMPLHQLESELFGFERGAFGGAVSAKAGKIEQASGTTLILEEVSALDENLQTQLMRVIQDAESFRMGGKSPIPVDVRIIATTSKSLTECVKEGSFREDLFHRLNVVNLTLPPLRERLGDIRILSQHWMSECAHRLTKGVVGFRPDAISLLESHVWPGNLKELQSVIERAVGLAQGSFVEVQNIQFDRRDVPRPVAPSHFAEIIKREGVPAPSFQAGLSGMTLSSGIDQNWTPGRTLDDIERNVILEALRYHNGNRTHTAKALGISIRTLRNKLADYRLLGIHA